MRRLDRSALMTRRTFRQCDIFPSRFLLLVLQVRNNAVQIIIEPGGQFVSDRPNFVSW
jgi:hypothetical protein